MGLGASRVINTLMDLSALVNQTMQGYVMMVIQAERGTIGLPQVVTSEDEYYRAFGKKVNWTNDPLLVITALKLGAKLILTRAAHYTDNTDVTSLTALAATGSLMDRGSMPLTAGVTSKTGPFYVTVPLPGSVVGVESGPFTFATGVSDKMSLTAGDGTGQVVTLVGTAITSLAVCDQINTQAPAVTAAVGINGVIVLSATDIAKSLTINTVTDDAYSVLGFSEATFAASLGTNQLSVSIGGGSPQTFTLTGKGNSFVLTSSQVAAQLAGLSGAVATSKQSTVVLTTTTAGATSSVQILSASTVNMGFPNTAVSGFSGSSMSTLGITAINEGEWGDRLLVSILPSLLDPVNKFDMRVDYLTQSNMQENYTGLNMDPTDATNYAVHQVNIKSQLIRLTDESSTNPLAARLPLLTIMPYQLTGGDNGGQMLDSDWIGDPVAETGMYALDNAPYISIDFMIPGCESETVAQAMAAYAENRGDLIGYVKTPAFLDPEDAIAWRMGTAPWTHAAFDSMRLVIMYGDVLVYDDFDNSYKYISCLGHYAAKITLSDANYGPSFAIAGDRRGKVGLVEGIYCNVQSGKGSGYADLFNEYGINYLMISSFPGDEGAVFWEQHDSQIEITNTRNLNVARFCTYIFVTLTPALRAYVFDPNHPVTWAEVNRELTPVFDRWCNNMSIYTYELQTDKDAYFAKNGTLMNAVMNTGLTIDQGIYYCRVFIEVVQAISYFYFTVAVTPTGQAFSQFDTMTTLPGTVRA